MLPQFSQQKYGLTPENEWKYEVNFFIKYKKKNHNCSLGAHAAEILGHMRGEDSLNNQITSHNCQYIGKSFQSDSFSNIL